MFLLPISVFANFLFFFFLSFSNTRGVFNTLVTNTRSEERARESACAQPVNGEINPLMYTVSTNVPDRSLLEHNEGARANAFDQNVSVNCYKRV